MTSFNPKSTLHQNFLDFHSLLRINKAIVPLKTILYPTSHPSRTNQSTLCIAPSTDPRKNSTRIVTMRNYPYPTVRNNRSCPLLIVPIKGAVHQGVARINRLSKPLLTTCRGFKVESLQVVAAAYLRKSQLLAQLAAAVEVRSRKRLGSKDTHLAREKGYWITLDTLVCTADVRCRGSGCCGDSTDSQLLPGFSLVAFQSRLPLPKGTPEITGYEACTYPVIRQTAKYCPESSPTAERKVASRVEIKSPTRGESLRGQFRGIYPIAEGVDELGAVGLGGYWVLGSRFIILVISRYASSTGPYGPMRPEWKIWNPLGTGVAFNVLNDFITHEGPDAETVKTVFENELTFFVAHLGIEVVHASASHGALVVKTHRSFYLREVEASPRTCEKILETPSSRNLSTGKVQPKSVRVIDATRDKPLSTGTTLGPINEGSMISLFCESSEGKPVPTVEWYKNDQLLEANSSTTVAENGIGNGSSLLQMQITRDELNATFTCKVNSTTLVEPLSVDVKLDVHERALLSPSGRQKPPPKEEKAPST
ncbi:hypothetical protein WN48_05337 [Eufriesea mexicana]|uniref:Ig-like domain-containing protein n=1 Tax=Eufriesea mexicana TaxID=516756 RepID=A0A310SU92_9HYME|nr:hypothetical protein WN48_05337 [Eufriesea mexicana]